MQRKMTLFLMLLVSATSLHSRTEQPRTCYVPRSISSYIFYTDKHQAPVAVSTKKTSISHTLIYQESANASKSAPFFLGDDRTSLLINENELGEVNSDWLHIESADNAVYSSTIKIAPKKTTLGVCLHSYYSLDQLCEGLWACVVVPVVQVTHELRPSEVKKPTSIVSPDSQFTSVLAALDWDNWRAGKWSQQEQTIIGVDDVLVQIGLRLKGPLESVQDVSLEVAMPLGHRPTGQYLFEPLIGSQGSVGVGGAIKTIAPLVTWGPLTLSYVGHVAYRYYFQAHQPRLFDLKGQPFSRYLVYMDTDLTPHTSNVAVKASNGPNFFLRDCLVTPGATGQSVTALQCGIGSHKLQFGYQYWWRVAEQVMFAAPLERTFATPSPRGLSAGNQLWLTAPQITDKFSVDDLATSSNPAVVRDIEFDIDSGAMPQVASHTVYVDFNSVWENELVAVTMRIGLGYEFGKNPAVLDSVHGWCGIGITF